MIEVKFGGKCNYKLRHFEYLNLKVKTFLKLCVTTRKKQIAFQMN